MGPRRTRCEAATPALGYAATVISVCVLLFLGLVALIFWIGGLAEEPVISGVGSDPVPSPAAGD